MRSRKGEATITAPIILGRVIFFMQPAMADLMPAGEFDCSECGRHIVQIAGPVSEFALCAACMTIPGWFNYPEIAELIDPERDRDG